MQQQDHFPPIPGLTGRFFSPSLPDSTTRHHQQPHPQPVKCPRCDSPNTKFCYFNNYNLSQPRHFCKACRRYWTKGGVLRNVPVGGATRKNPSKSKPAKPKPANKPPKPKPAAGSSSDSSSITAATSADPDPIPAELGTDPVFPDPGLVNGFRVPDPGVGGLDWGVSMFDMTSSVDPAVYWNQTAQWGDTDPSLYLP